MKLTSMKLTKSDVERQQEKYSKPAPADAERYPYGLELHLDNQVLDKCGLDELPEVGSTMTLMATVKVTSVSSRDEVDGDKRNSVSLQITAMGLESDATDNTKKVEKLYG
jgi:hypothetical protein